MVKIPIGPYLANTRRWPNVGRAHHQSNIGPTLRVCCVHSVISVLLLRDMLQVKYRTKYLNM